MFSAIEELTGQVVFASDKNAKNLSLVDPIFQKKVFFRKEHFRGETQVRAHFVSTATNEKMNDQFLFDKEYLEVQKNGMVRLGESLAHLTGKLKIKEWAESSLSPCQVKIEHRIPISNKQGKIRIIDVAVLFPEGNLLALECQLSPISSQELKDRYYDYLSEGVDSIWFLGAKARTPECESFLLNETGECPLITFAEHRQVIPIEDNNSCCHYSTPENKEHSQGSATTKSTRLIPWGGEQLINKKCQITASN